MASNAEMLRLIKHVSTKLGSSRQAIATRTSETFVDRRTIDSALMAMAYAEAVLSMVGSCVMPDDVDDEVPA